MNASPGGGSVDRRRSAAASRAPPPPRPRAAPRPRRRASSRPRRRAAAAPRARTGSPRSRPAAGIGAAAGAALRKNPPVAQLRRSARPSPAGSRAGRAPRRRRRARGPRAQLQVRAGRDDDLVLARSVDGDERDPGRRRRRASTGRARPLRRAARRARARPNVVVADAARSASTCGAEARGSDRLVRALAAGNALKRRSRDRLPGPRQPLGTRATRSRLIEPTTVRCGAGTGSVDGERAQVVERAPEQVLAQVEQPRPERPALGCQRRSAQRR